jgi:ribosome-associated protein
MDARKLARQCLELADSKKAEDIVILDVRKLTSITDYFVIATGSSDPHVRAVVDEIAEKLRVDYDLRPRATDGTVQSKWIVLDYDNVIVHVMRPDVRVHYDLENLWSDAPQVKPRKKKTEDGKTGPVAAKTPRIRKTKTASAK